MGSNRTGWLMLAPTLFILGVFGIIPFFYVLWVSFHQWNPFGANPAMIYNGANNFRRLVFDPEFLTSIWFTLNSPSSPSSAKSSSAICWRSF